MALVLLFCALADGVVTARNPDPSGGWSGVRAEAVRGSQHRSVLLW